jgi:uncharacterized protein (DUF488 family)
MNDTIFTVGHSNRSLEELCDILKAHNIELLVDVRGGRFVGSRKFPHFNKENLIVSIPEHGIGYEHIGELGGRRSRQPVEDDMVNAGWILPAFKNYADYALISPDFKAGLEKLVSLSNNARVAYMCSEAVPWRCHRSIISDWVLATTEKTVLHITSKTSKMQGRLAKHAVVVDGKVTYPAPV